MNLMKNGRDFSLFQDHFMSKSKTGPFKKNFKITISWIQSFKNINKIKGNRETYSKLFCKTFKSHFFFVKDRFEGVCWCCHMTAKIITNYFCFWRADSGNSSFVNLAPKTFFCFSREIEACELFFVFKLSSRIFLGDNGFISSRCWFLARKFWFLLLIT